MVTLVLPSVALYRGASRMIENGSTEDLRGVGGVAVKGREKQLKWIGWSNLELQLYRLKEQCSREMKERNLFAIPAVRIAPTGAGQQITFSRPSSLVRPHPPAVALLRWLQHRSSVDTR